MLCLRDAFLSSLTTRCITNTEPQKRVREKKKKKQESNPYMLVQIQLEKYKRSYDDDSPLQKLHW